MKWVIKTIVFKGLSALPAQIGDYLYHKIQEIGLDKKFKMSYNSNKSSFKKFNEIINQLNYNLDNTNVLEIGTGWFPFFPYFLISEKKINEISTIDLNQHMKAKYVRMVEQKLLDENIINSESVKLNGFLNDKIKYFPKTSLTTVDVSEVNLVFSRFVLEHVYPSSMLEIHEYLFNNMPINSRIIHMISPGDHRSYYDNNLSNVDFLKYTDAEWEKLCTRFDYHNRMRVNEYISMFEKIGFIIEYLESDNTDVNTLKYKKYKQLRLNEKYLNNSDEVNLAGSINIVLKKEI
jgi:hypothetical protein